MIAALGTLAFLGTLWMLVVVGAAVLEESGAKIAAALRGEPMPNPVLALKSTRSSAAATSYTRPRAVARRRLTRA